MRLSARRVAPFYGVVVVVTLLVAAAGLTADAQSAPWFQGSVGFENVGSSPFTVFRDFRFENRIGPFAITGRIAAAQSGSSVTGTLFFDPDPIFGQPIAPCNFTAVVAGDRVDGILDPATCGGSGSFVVHRV